MAESLLTALLGHNTFEVDGIVYRYNHNHDGFRAHSNGFFTIDPQSPNSSWDGQLDPTTGAISNAELDRLLCDC